MATLTMIYQPLTSNIFHHTPTVSLLCVVTLLHLCAVFVQLLIVITDVLFLQQVWSPLSHAKCE